MRITILITISIFLFIYTTIGINISNCYFDHITIANGLSQNYITDIEEDCNGFVWIGTKNGLNKYDGYEMTIYNHIPGNLTSIPNNYISILFRDSKNNLWIGTNSGLCKYIEEDDSFEVFLFETKKQPHANYNILSLFEDKNQVLWIGTAEGYLFSFYPDKKKLKAYPSSFAITNIIGDKNEILIAPRNTGTIHFDPVKESFHKTAADSTLEAYTVTKLMTDPRGRLWIGTQNNGIFEYDNHQHKLGNQTILDIHFYKDTFALIGTEEEGLFCYNLYTEEYQSIDNKQKGSSLNSEGITSLHIDSSDIIWLGTINGGVNKFDPNRNIFKHLSLTSENDYPSSTQCVYTIEALNNHSIIAGLNTKGIYIVNIPSNEVDKTGINKLIPQLNDATINTVLKDSRDLLWIGTYKKSLFLIGPDQLTAPIHKRLKEYLPSISSVKYLFEDSKQCIWIGTDDSMLRYDPKQSHEKSICQYDFPNLITSITEDRNHHIWVATNNGLHLYDQKQNSFNRAFLPDEKSPYTLPNTIIPICPIGDTLWLGTRQGLIKYTYKDNQSQTFSVENGLPSESIKGLLYDNSNNNLWISTDRGLSCMDLSSNKFTNFGLQDGITGTEFNDMSFMKGTDGTFYFGSVDGIYCFHPNQIKSNANPPKVVISGYRLYDDIPSNKQSGNFSKIPIPLNKEITIPFKQSIFSIDFVALNYTNSLKNQYAYKLGNYDNSWHYVGKQRMATYTNLNPGTYQFRVKASNNDGVWNEEGCSLKIIILPPWWQTTWAYLIYVLLIGGIIFISIRIYTNRIKIENQLANEQFERAQLEKLDQLKSQFFSNVTHEFRTPLTLIISPLEAICNKKGKLDPGNDYLLTIKNNAYKLLDLVNRLLDFSKVESRCFSFNSLNTEIISFIKNGVDSFRPLAAEKKINLSYRSNKESFVCLLDPNILEKILFNLLSNAIKYTPENGSVDVSLIIEQDNQLKLTIKDTGKGIPENKLPLVFERFYQLDGDTHNGTGIGLSLVKSLVELHHGNIEIESKLNQGTEFSICIPFNAVSSPSSIPASEKNIIAETEKENDYLHLQEPLENQKNGQERPTVLIAEDNNELRQFIKSILYHKYNILEAENGLIALELARKECPDIILSDVLMPEMDGKQLCLQVKQDIQTCHIAFIMITALISETNQIEGLSIGADDYIVKPFNPEILKYKIRNTIKNRILISRRYAALASQNTKEIIAEDKDTVFLVGIIEYIKASLSDPNLRVDDLAKNAGMSRTPFFKKIKSLTGMSPNDFISNIRLNQAAKLLSNSNQSITEIAYQTGFTSPKYFRECFKKQFGKTPSEYIEEHKV